MSDGGRIIYLMDEGKLIEIRTPSRIYRNTPEDKFMLSLEFSISKKDSDDKAIVVVRGLEKKARDGWRPGVAPQGYLNDRTTESGFRRILTDPERFSFIKKIFELFYGGTPVREIHRMAKDEWHLTSRPKKRSGGVPLSLSMVYAILTNPFYCGKFEYPERSGKWYEGKHDKAVSEEVFEEIQLRLGNKSQYKTKHEYAYTGLMRCGFCQSRITAEQKWQCICRNCKLKFSLTKKNKEMYPACKTRIEHMKNPTIMHPIYYRCTRKKNPACKQRGVRLENLERQIDQKLSEIEISPLFLDWAVRQIKKMGEDERNFREDTVAAIKRAHDECRTRLDNLFHFKISPANRDGSLLSDEKYKLEHDKLDKELKSLEKQLVSIDDHMMQATNEAVKAFTFAAKARERFATGDLKTKREIFMTLGSRLTLLDKTVHFDSPSYMFTFKKMKEEAPIIIDRIAPNLQSQETTKMEEIYSSIHTVLRG